MNTSATMDDSFDRSNNGQQRLGRSAKRAGERFRRNSASDVATLIADVEDLLQKVAHLADSEVTEIRERLIAQIAGVKETLTNQGAQIANMARNAAGATDDYLHENPWQTTGIATLVGLTLGYFLFRR
jgi:ElaB/YqjD/DUF883 family membrane-anchored ribosome-binding protein